MPFIEQCSCHVWAIDGWRNDGQSATVNERYDRAGNAILFEPKAKPILNDKISILVAAARVEGFTQARCIIYGGFEKITDGAPEHMWLEYNGYIYDTMPGWPLCKLQANENTRRGRTACETQTFPDARRGVFQSFLTTTQLQIITSSVWNAANQQITCEHCTPQ